MITLGELLDAYKIGSITRDEAIEAIEMRIEDASIAILDKLYSTRTKPEHE